MQKKCRNTELDDEFIEKKKEIMKRKMVQRKEKRRLLAAKNKQLRKSKKVKHEKEDKKVIWQYIRELNSNFAKMKGIKKQNKKTNFISIILFKAFILCDMTAAYHSLLHAKLHKKKKLEKLNNLTCNFELGQISTRVGLKKLMVPLHQIFNAKYFLKHQTKITFWLPQSLDSIFSQTLICT